MWDGKIASSDNSKVVFGSLGYHFRGLARLDLVRRTFDRLGEIETFHPPRVRDPKVLHPNRRHGNSAEKIGQSQGLFSTIP